MAGQIQRSKLSAEKQNFSNKRLIKKPVLAQGAAIDPDLALLFASSVGPAKHDHRSPIDKLSSHKLHPDEGSHNKIAEAHGSNEAVEKENIHSNRIPAKDSQVTEQDQPHAVELATEALSVFKSERKRKRKPVIDDLEGKYMQRLAIEEEKEEIERENEKALKRLKLVPTEIPHQQDKDSDDKSNDSLQKGAMRFTEEPVDIPIHESITHSKNDDELEKASRTVFLANVSTLAISSKTSKKILLAHMSSFLAELPSSPEGKPAHKVESLRFRSTAYAGTALPKKAAFAKKELMGATTKSTNAYVVYSSAYAAREAVKRLNGTIILDRHLRVDGVAHPSKTDHRRCVFVGNLGFVDDESLLDQDGQSERKRSKIPSDVEEGLWRQFTKAGTVESVRVVRDEKTRVGKGFAYVQFKDPNSVEAALLFNEKKFPPMLPRVLRVVRAKAVNKTALAVAASRANKTQNSSSKARVFNPKISPEQSSLHGRALKLLGRAGAAQMKKSESSGANATVIGRQGSSKTGHENFGQGIESGVPKPPQSFVFEGYRATINSGKSSKSKLGDRSGKKSNKPKTKTTKRSSQWKKNGARKSQKS